MTQKFAKIAFGISINFLFLFLIHVCNSFNFVSNSLKGDECSMTITVFYQRNALKRVFGVC